MLINIFQMEAIGPGQARLSINLKPYLDALHSHQDVDKVFYQYLEPLTKINGAALWVTFVSKALEQESEQENFESTPLYQILKENGVELIKNSMDALLFAALDNPAIPSTVEIDLYIEFDGQFKVTIKDNGPGFPDGFLSYFQSDEHILNFLHGRESYRKKTHQQVFEELNEDLLDWSDATTDESSFSSRAPTPFSVDSEERLSPLSIRSFGGRGIGLRNLASQILTGHPVHEFRT